MKFVVWVLILAGLALGGKYLYDNGYMDSFLTSFNNAVERTSNFATDKAVKEANFE